MAIPQTRADLLNQLQPAYAKLHHELQRFDEKTAQNFCVESGTSAPAWRVKDLIAVRAWWSESLVQWIARGRCDDRTFELPAPGYGWNETPRLNNDVVQERYTHTFADSLRRLDFAYQEVIELIDLLSDQQLSAKHQFFWAGNYPVCRWISINTTRQYTTARTLLRKVTF
ncbi:MAG: ClbS/DfsB family four-helix bundle protein [Pseudomonadota bacterium]